VNVVKRSILGGAGISFLLLTEAVLGQPSPYRPEFHRAPFLNLSNAKSVPTHYTGTFSHARSLSAATADFDEDGMPDLAAAFATTNGNGAIAIHRGNLQALWPYGALRGTDPPAFLPDARVFAIPAPPDFLAAGDFDADGHWDLVAAQAGSPAIYFLKGDGHGGFADPQLIPLPGLITAMTSGDINRSDGLIDLMVAVTGDAGPQVLVFESPNGALRGEAEAFPLPAEAGSLAVIALDGGIRNGFAVAAGHELVLVHGRDRRLTRGKEERDKVPAATVTRQSFPFILRSLAAGNFTSATQDLAVLADDGWVHILERSDAATPARRRPSTTTMSMAERHAVALPYSIRQTGTSLVTARVAATGRDSLIAIDADAGKLHVISHTSREDPTSLSVSASLDIGGTPAVVLPMRINKDPLHDLVVLAAAQSQPIAIQTTPGVVFTVTNTHDEGNGSLRQALQGAGIVPAASGPVEIEFNIPDTDPNRDPTTGVFTIQPIGLNELEALPGVPGGVTVDAYTQPGASPNSLTNGDNAKILIEINGSLAGAGPSGLSPGGNTIRGFTFTNFLEAPNPNGSNTSIGGAGIDIESSQNFIEGNFFGTDASGKFAKPNSLGIVSFDGAHGNVIGGTTPQARNILSGNSYHNLAIGLEPLPNTYLVEGNYVGTDATGTQPLGGVEGVELAGINTVIGGTAAGAGNLISGNSSDNVFLVQTQGCGNFCVPVEGSLVQGNYIGTDFTGTHRLGVTNNGVYLIQATDNTIGGTSPAARNIISGNGGSGINLAGGTTGSIIEGNYIGVDVTGAVGLNNVGSGITLGVSFELNGNGTVFYQGSPAVNNLIGGEVSGTANVISGNLADGIAISSSSGVVQNNVFAGNLIGTDSTGVNPIGNHLDGIFMQANAAGNVVGGATPGAANVIAFNRGDGVTIDPGANTATNNSVVGNIVDSNSGAGVRIPTGTGNTVSRNQIYSNSALGIDIDTAGVLSNSACQSNTSGANLLQDAPVLTAGTGNTFVTATATDPNGNTSEFSNCVPASLSGNVLSIAGTLNSKASTNYTVEYFSNTSCDASGFGQGKVYLGAATVATNASCSATLNSPINLTNADVSVAITSVPFSGQEYTSFPFTATVSNNGPATATSLILTDTLAAGVNFISATPTQGSCAFSNGTVTCNLGNLPVGQIITVGFYIVTTSASAFSNTVTIASSTPDGNTANNTATFTKTPTYSPFLSHLTPSSVVVGSPDIQLSVIGFGFTPATTVTYNGVATPATFDPNWNPSDCPFQTGGFSNYCTALTITVHAAQLATVASVPVGIGGITLPFSITNPPIVIGPVTHFVVSPLPNPYPAGSQQLLAVTAEDANNNVVQAYTGTVNLTSTDPAATVFTAGGGTAALTFTTTQAGQYTTVVTLQTYGTQSITATDANNASITGTLGGIAVQNGAAANLILTGSPQAAAPGQPFAQPLSVTVTDAYGNVVPNQLISFTPPSSGASAMLSSNTATSNSQGVASVNATANTVAGAYAVGVTIGASTGTRTDVFLLNNGSGLATLTATSGTPQTTFLGTLFANPLRATLLDGLGTPISGATVRFNSSGIVVVTPAPLTDTSGVASTVANSALNGTAGTFPVTATAGGLTATFTLTQNPGEPVLVTITGGSPQTTAAGAPFGSPLSVHVTDQVGHPRSGVVVTYIPPATGASATLPAGTVSTNALGDASLGATANTTQGTYNVTASVGGVTATFVLTNGPPVGGTPASIVAYAGTPQSRGAGTPFVTAFKALVKDGTGSPVSGASVTFTAPATGATGTFPGAVNSATVLTDGLGFATAPTFTASTVTGSYSVTARVLTLTATFSLTNSAGAPAGLAVYTGDNQSATVNTNFGTALAVQVVDSYGNPCGAAGAGLAGSFSVNAGDSGATATTSGNLNVTTNSNGIATAPVLTANGTSGAFSVTALFFIYTPSFQPLFQTFSLSNTIAAPAALAVSAGSPQTATVTTAFPLMLSAKVTDSGNNPLPGFTVNFAAPASGASAVLTGANAITNASGIASVAAIANAINGSYNVTASIGPFTGLFALTNTGVAYSKCDVNQDSATNLLDAQLIVNEALGAAASLDLSGDGAVSVDDVQIVINAVLQLGCSAH
jgi:hypothetical protein